MGAVVERINRAPPALWLDAHDYSAALLAGGQAPLLDAGAYLAWQRKQQGLLKADFAALDAAPVAAAWLASKPALREAMGAKTRVTFPLKTLLADDGLRAHLAELLTALRTGITGLPLVLAVPSPRRWLALAYAQAHGSAGAVEIGEDDIDAAAVLLADALRVIAASGIDGLLLEEGPDASLDATTLGAYGAVLNLASHYRWDLGFRLSAIDASADPAAAGVGFAIAPATVSGVATLHALPEDFIDGSAAPAPGPRFLAIPAGANPERVLARLSGLH